MGVARGSRLGTAVGVGLLVALGKARLREREQPIRVSADLAGGRRLGTSFCVGALAAVLDKAQVRESEPMGVGGNLPRGGRLGAGRVGCIRNGASMAQRARGAFLGFAFP